MVLRPETRHRHYESGAVCLETARAYQGAGPAAMGQTEWSQAQGLLLFPLFAAQDRALYALDRRLEAQEFRYVRGD